jgi:selenocysteine lyase/cysteine desulfurase
VYPSTPVILRRLEQTQGVELRMANHRSGATTIEDFARLVDDRTRLVSVALVSNISGYRHDMRALAELAHSHGAYLYADAVQAVGMGPLDVKALDIDFLTTGCYKWLGAGFGVAPFYVRRELLDRIHPQNVGWRVEKRLGGYEYQHYRTAKKFEYASLAFGEVYQLAAALKYLESIGLDRIEAQSLALVEQLRKGLGARGFHILTPSGTRSSIVSFYIKEESPAAERILEDAKIKVSLQTGDRTDAYGGTAPLTRVRVSLSFFNNAGDVDRFLEVSAKLGTT